MSGKIVGAELVVGIEAFGRQILGPARDGRPPLCGKVRAVLDVRERAETDQHVAALFDRHLVLLAPLAAPVALTVAQRVLADIVRREVERPARVRGVKQDGRERGTRQRGAQQREVRQLRIEDIDGPHAAVAGVLLGKIERLAVRIGDQLAGRERLTVGQRRQRGVFLAADACEVGHQRSVERRHARVKRRVIALRRRQHVGERESVPPPPCLERAVEEHHRLDIVIREQQVGFGRRDRAEIACEHEGRPRFAHGDASARRRGQPEAPPVDPDTVARPPQHRLDIAPHAPGIEPGDLRLAEHDRLRVVAHRDGGGDVDLELKRARPAVTRFRLERDIGDRAGKDIQVVGQQRRGEHEFRLDRAVREGGDRAQRPNRDTGLRQRRRVGGLGAQKPVGLAVHAQHGVDRLARARPMFGRRIGQPVRRRPDRKERIDRHQRDRRRPQRPRRSRTHERHNSRQHPDHLSHSHRSSPSNTPARFI